MTISVVPILRVRRATTTWSYKVPEGSIVVPGALVIVPFRGHPVLGVVWDGDATTKAKLLPVTEILTTTPVVRAPHRRTIEWLSETGMCSLSTALYTWLPAALRQLPLTKPVRATLSEWDTNQPSAKETALCKQHAVVVPNHRPAAELALKKRYKELFATTFHDTPVTEFATWVAVAQGKIQVVVGRERALWLPWLNLQHCTVIEPEDISYHTGQTPYINLVEAAEFLSSATSAALTLRTHVPQSAAEVLWPAAVAWPLPTVPVEVTDLRRERLLNERLLSRIQEALKTGHVIMLYNARDRAVATEDGYQKVVPGVETIAKQLAAHFGGTLPQTLRFGTRQILTDLPRTLSLAIVLNLDPLLGNPHFADQLHGWGDLGHLISTGAPLHIQCHEPEHPLVQSLVHGSFVEYCRQITNQIQQAGLPPFQEEIVCATPGTDAEELYQELNPLVTPPWQLSYPRAASRRREQVTIVTLQAPRGTRLPAPVRTKLIALPRPWHVERGPWYS